MFDYSINKYLDFFCDIIKKVYFCKNYGYEKNNNCYIFAFFM